jgi:hypothetical protein
LTARMLAHEPHTFVTVMPEDFARRVLTGIHRE